MTQPSTAPRPSPHRNVVMVPVALHKTLPSQWVRSWNKARWILVSPGLARFNAKQVSTAGWQSWAEVASSCDRLFRSERKSEAEDVSSHELSAASALEGLGGVLSRDILLDFMRVSQLSGSGEGDESHQAPEVSVTERPSELLQTMAEMFSPERFEHSNTFTASTDTLKDLQSLDREFAEMYAAVAPEHNDVPVDAPSPPEPDIPLIEERVADEPVVANEVHAPVEPVPAPVPSAEEMAAPVVADDALSPAPSDEALMAAAEPAPAAAALADTAAAPEIPRPQSEPTFAESSIPMLEDSMPADNVVPASDVDLDRLPEASPLQGLFIQKEYEMTEIQEAQPEVEVPASSTPITTAELQEVAAVLSVPQLDMEPDDVLSDVQSTLNSLAGMAQGLSQQKQATVRLQDALEERSNQLQERERQMGEKEAHLLHLETHLKETKADLERMAAENNRLLAERSEALKELAQSVDARDKITLKRAEAVQVEQQRVDELSVSLRSRVMELDERESALKRKSEELALKLKQLQSAKDKFSTIVKSFNETVQFNSTLSAISKTVTE